MTLIAQRLPDKQNHGTLGWCHRLPFFNLNPAVKNEKKGQSIVYEWVTRKRTCARVATKFFSFYDH
jgi:hypothetical protein